MIMIRRGAFGLEWLFFCMFELIGRVVSEIEATGRGEPVQLRRGRSRKSRLRWRPAYFVAISLSGIWGSTNRTLNVGMAQMFGGLLFFYLLYFSSYYLRFLSFQFGSSRLFFALSRHIVQIIQGRYIHSGITGF